ncbi:MAG: hypothetical protein RI947_715 [Candidatus Parcubacteria bacterium]
MEPNGIPMLRIDLQGPHVQAAIKQAQLTLGNEFAPEADRLLAHTFLAGLQMNLIHLGVLIYFAKQTGTMMEWPVELPMGVTLDLYAPFVASAADPTPTDAYGAELPFEAAHYQSN